MQQPFAEFAYCEVSDGSEGGGVVGVDDQTGDFVVFIGYDGFVEEVSEGQVG